MSSQSNASWTHLDVIEARKHNNWHNSHLAMTTLSCRKGSTEFGDCLKISNTAWHYSQFSSLIQYCVFLGKKKNCFQKTLFFKISTLVLYHNLFKFPAPPPFFFTHFCYFLYILIFQRFVILLSLTY